jgi:hypothetical protein
VKYCDIIVKMYSKICIKREEKLPAPAPALAPAPAPSLGSVLWLRLPALCSHLPFNAGVGLGFHPSSGSGSSSGCGSTLPPPPQDQPPLLRGVPPDAVRAVPSHRIAAVAGMRAEGLTGGSCGRGALLRCATAVPSQRHWR